MNDRLKQNPAYGLLIILFGNFMTTVKQLIKHLKTLDQDAKVVTRADEGGYQGLWMEKEPFELALDVNDSPYKGPHEKKERVEETPYLYIKNYKVVKAYLL